MPVVGKNLPHDSAYGHVSGESIYIDDMPSAKNELIVDFYGSPVAHGRIRSLNLEAAKKVPGIAGLFTYKDLGGVNKFGPIIADEVLLVEEVCQFIGHPIVVIAGQSREAVLKARSLIEIDIEELPAIFTIDEAIAARQFIGEARFIRRGDIEQAFKAAEFVIEGQFINGGQDHFYLESQAAIVYPGEQNTLVVHSSTQNPSEVQEVVAHVLGLKHSQVVCTTKRMGGGFGGKECQATHPAAMAALVALKTKRPARIALSKDDDMCATGGRHPFQNNYKVAFTADGLITAMQVDLYSDGGAFADLSTAVMGRAMCHAENAYYVPVIEIKGSVCKTNLPPNTAFRGFGGPQGVATMENIIEEIAVYLNKDAFDIRRLNCYGTNERNITPYGQIVFNNMLPQIFDQLAETSEYKRRRKEVAEFNKASKTHLKGLSMSAVKFGISFNTKFLNQANALVLIFKDGTIQVSTGATEMGQGVNTKIRQLVADEFAIDPDDVILMPTTTDKNNNTSATAASSAADLNGSAAVNACRLIRQRLAECASWYLSSIDSGFSPSVENIVFEDGQVFDRRRPDKKLGFGEMVDIAYHERVNLGERGFYATQGVDFSWKTGTGNPFLYFTNGACVSEVLIDRFTGELKVLRADVLMDIGRSINPGVDRGQITGAFVQGMGWVTTEELKRSANGVLLSHSPTTYKIPNIQDLPAVFNVDVIANADNHVNIKGSKAVGEPPLLLGISVWTAVKNALSYTAAGKIPKLKLPATNEEIFTRLRAYKETAANLGEIANS
jgi:xanthine dehydrogenase large subunit